MAKAKEIEAQLHRAEAELRLLQKISRLFAKSPPLHDSLRQVAHLVSGFMHGDSCLVYLVSGEELVLCAADGPNPGAVGDVKLRLSEGLTGWVARERRMLAISREAYLDPRFKSFRDLPEDSYEAFLSAPAIAKNRVVGVVNVQHRQPHSHTGEELEVITTVGEQVGALVAMSCLDPADLDRTDFAEIAMNRLLARLA